MAAAEAVRKVLLIAEFEHGRQEGVEGTKLLALHFGAEIQRLDEQTPGGRYLTVDLEKLAIQVWVF